MNPSTKFVCGLLVASASAMLSSGAFAADKLPTGYGDPNNDLVSGDVDGLTWTDAARAYTIGDDVVLVFTDTTAGNCSFTIADGIQADGRYLLVGGGGAGGSAHGALNGAGGGAGGFVEGNLKFDAATYSVTVGQGGSIKTTPGTWDKGYNGGDSLISFNDSPLLTAKGGGAGGSGSGNTTNLSGANGGSGGGASNYNGTKGTVGQGESGQGYAGGDSNVAGHGAGGGGAGELGGNAVAGSIWVGGKGGDGKKNNITGEDVWYAGGGAGGSAGAEGQDKIAKGGTGGGGSSRICVSEKVCITEDGTDELGGGGAGASALDGNGNGWNAGRGGNGVVVVRLTLPKPDVIEGLSFKGASEVFNIGEGDKMETVLVFKNTEKAGTFTLAGDADVRVLLVGGGGAGGNSGAVNMVGGGGGAGGFVEKDNVELGIGSYSVTVGKGGVPNGNKDYGSDSNPNNNGTDSFVQKNEEDVFRAIGGGAGGIPNGNYRTHLSEGKTGGSGGGGAVTYTWDYWYYGQIGGAGVDGQGCAGGKAYKNTFSNAGGGGGARAAGDDAIADGKSGNGGDGLSSDITGAEVWYAGGGAGGAYSQWTHFSVSGGKGGGGGSTSSSDGGVAKAYSEDGTDGLGGGGAGCSCSYNDQYNPQRAAANAGRGGNGVVIVRVKKIYPNEPLPGVGFEGEAEWYNIGHGKTRETVVIYTNVNEVGKLTLGRRATARVLLVGGGGAGGNSGQSKTCCAGGGAGGFVETNALQLVSGTYSITVGKGGLPNKDCNTRGLSGNGNPSSLVGAKVSLTAFGGGAGGIANGALDSDHAQGRGGAEIGSGGGGAHYAGNGQNGKGGVVDGTQGCNGGSHLVEGNFNDKIRAGSGGGGAGGQGADATTSQTGGAGGVGKMSTITGKEIWYAGGGAGGGYYWTVGDRIADGGKGGGGSSIIKITKDTIAVSEQGVDGLGGGGAGSCGAEGNGKNPIGTAGRGGNGIVIVRITEVAPPGLVFLIE